MPVEHPFTTDAERIDQLRAFGKVCRDLAEGFSERGDLISAHPFSVLAVRAEELLADGWEQSDLKALGLPEHLASTGDDCRQDDSDRRSGLGTGALTIGSKKELQVTYKGKRLYRFVSDHGTTVNGNGVGDFTVPKVG